MLSFLKNFDYTHGICFLSLLFQITLDLEEESKMGLKENTNKTKLFSLISILLILSALTSSAFKASNSSLLPVSADGGSELDVVRHIDCTNLFPLVCLKFYNLTI